MVDEKKRITLPRYQQIAVDIAERITENRYSVGEKLHARSTLASTYGVSPETTRKAINVLVDLGIMEVKHGSGVYVASKERAKNFALQYRDVQSVQQLKNEIMVSVERQKAELNNFSAVLGTLVTQTKRLNTINPFVPFELVITAEAKHLEETVSELSFWQHTAATLIAIKHQDELLLSPGPYAKISANDTIYFIGNELSLQRVESFFYG